jgi:hypothetical protein
MKKFLILVLMMFLLVGCTSNEDKQYQEYENKAEQLKNRTEFESTNDFNLLFNYEEVNDGYRYVVTIDSTKVDMYDIRMICFGGEKDDDILPNLGFFDEEQYHLVVNVVDKANGYYKGISLSGLVDNISEVKIYIHYYTDEKMTDDKELYLKVEK